VSQEIAVAIVGTGDWGANLVRNFAVLPGARLVALCDADSERLRRTAARYGGARAVETVEEVAADPQIQAAVVSASAASHHALARALLIAGKDVFVEKPLALSVADAEELVALAAEHQRILMVGHLLLYHPAVRYLKDLVQRGELGDPYYVTSQRLNLGKVRRDENALWSFAPHDLSVILHLLGAEPIDVARAAPHFSNRAWTTWCSSTCASPKVAWPTCTSPGSTRTRLASSPWSAAARWWYSTTWKPARRSASTTRASSGRARS